MGVVGRVSILARGFRIVLEEFAGLEFLELGFKGGRLGFGSLERTRKDLLSD